MFDLVDLDVPSGPKVRTMDFIKSTETLRNPMSQTQRPYLGQADFSLMVDAPAKWSRSEDDDSLIMFVDRPGTMRDLGEDEYQVVPPTDLGSDAFEKWARDISRCTELTFHSSGLPALDFSNFMDVPRAIPSKRLIADVVSTEGLESLAGLKWIQRCRGLLCIEFGPDMPVLQIVSRYWKYLHGTLVEEETPFMVTFIASRDLGSELFLMAGFDNE